MQRHKGMDIAQTVISKRNGASIDVTNRLTVQPVITQVVNNESTATFSIVNNIKDDTRNLLSSKCTRWSGGDGYVGAIANGDIVTITYINKELKIDQPLIRGIISTITCNQDTLEITVVDVIAELKKVGATYFRNHYSYKGRKENIRLPVIHDQSSNSVHIIKEENVPFEAVKFARNRTQSVSHSGSQSFRNGAEMTFTSEMSFIYSVTFWIRNTVFLTNVSYSITVRDTNSKGRILGEASGNRSYDLNSAPVTVTLNSNPAVNKIFVRIVQNDPNAAGNLDIDRNTASADGQIKFGSGAFGTGAFRMSISGAKDYFADGVDGTVDNGKYAFKINHIVDESNQKVPLNSNDTDPKILRGLGTWYSLNEKIPTIEVIDKILDANDYFLIPSWTGQYTDIYMLMCGGDHIYNYILAMANIENSNGHQSVMFADLLDNKGVSISRRMRLPDNKNDPKDINAPRFHISYAPDDPKMQKIWFKSFSPKMTIANKPVTSFIQGKDSNDNPIMIAVTDIRRMNEQFDIDLSSIALETGTSSVTDAARLSYADVIEHSASKLDGEIELSGIHNCFMPNGHKGFIDLKAGETYGSGVPITITDSRYCLSNEPVLVKEVVYNFRDLTTKLTLSNYSIANSNAIIDNSKMSLRAGNVATNAVNDNLRDRQYILVRTTGPHPGENNVVRLIREPGGTNNTSAPITAMTLHFPRLKMTLLSAYFPPNPAFTTKDHGIIGVEYEANGVKNTIPIKRSRRPDKNATQSLTVNIQVQHP